MSEDAAGKYETIVDIDMPEIGMRYGRKVYEDGVTIPWCQYYKNAQRPDWKNGKWQQTDVCVTYERMK